MLESNREYGSPSYLSDSLKSRDHHNDFYHSGSDEKNRSLNSGPKYESLKRSEREITDHLEKANKFQNERLNEELKSNAFYKRELENLRSALSDTRTKVNSNHFPNDDKDYLLESTKERIRNLQYQRENEVAHRSEGRSSSPSQFQETSLNSEKVYKNYSSHIQGEDHYRNFYPKAEGGYESEMLMDSVGTNKTYDLSQSLRGSSSEYQNKISGGLKNLEEKMNQMERELDDHLVHKNKEYFTNRELVKMKQRQREEELLKNSYKEEMEQTDEEDERMQSLQEKENRSEESNSNKIKTDSKFKDAFEKREEKLKKENEEVEKGVTRRTESQQNQRSLVESDEEIEEPMEERDSERELSLLREENRRIKQDLVNIKESYENEMRHGEIKAHPSNLVTEELILTTTPPLKSRTTVIRKPTKFESDKTLVEMMKEDEIKKTVTKARREVHNKLKQNKNQESKVINKRKTLTESHKKPEFIGVRNELYKKYYGHPTHLREATYFLNKGIPTSYMSDSRPQVEHNDPKKTLPKRYANALKY